MIKNRDLAKRNLEKYDKIVAQRERVQPYVTFKAMLKSKSRLGNVFIPNEIVHEEIMYYSDKKDEKSFEKKAIKEIMKREVILINDFKKGVEWHKKNPHYDYSSPYNPKNFKDTLIKKDVDYEITNEKVFHEVPKPLTFDDIKTL